MRRLSHHVAVVIAMYFNIDHLLHQHTLMLERSRTRLQAFSLVEATTQWPCAGLWSRSVSMQTENIPFGSVYLGTVQRFSRAVGHSQSSICQMVGTPSPLIDCQSSVKTKDNKWEEEGGK